MKIALSQLNYHIGNFEENCNKIIDAIKKAKNEGVNIVVFAELAICGYPPRDFLEFDDFIDKCDKAINQIAQHCVGIAAVVGAPSRNTATKGKSLFNSAFFLAEGEIQYVRHKSLLPNYDIFDEYRYFEPNQEFETITYKNHKIALTICEDLWNFGDHPLYINNPMERLAAQSPDFIINIAASPFHSKQATTRIEILRNNAKEYKIPLFYVNHVGAQTELLFDGGGLVINADGEIIDELKYFEEDFAAYSLDDIIDTSKSFNGKNSQSEISLIHDALVMGVRNYFEKLGFKKAILGLSGGIDSAVTLVLAERALGKENVHSILMPSQFSSDHSIDDAKLLAENLDTSYDIISIEQAYKSFDELLSPQFKGLSFGLAEENLQARIRAVLLMAMSNKFSYILLNTSNKSEAAVGYGTLYGDMCGGLSVLGDVYKKDVYLLAEYINKDSEIIPRNSIVKPPSAELRPDQKDSDSLPDYEILDKILYQYIEKRKGPAEIIAMGFNEALVKRTLKLVNTNEYKRYQAPPILRVSSHAFGMGRRMPIVARYLS